MKKIWSYVLVLLPAVLAAQTVFPSAGTPVIPANMAPSALSVKDGVMVLPSGKYFYSRLIASNLKCSDFRFLELEIKASDPVAMLAGIYWSRTVDKGLAEERKMVIRIPVTTGWQKYYLPLAGEGWNGTLKNFRLDFSVRAGVTAEVKSIRFVKEIARETGKRALSIFPGTDIVNHTLGNFRCTPQMIKFTMKSGYGYTAVIPVHYIAEQWRYLKVVFRAPKAASARVSTYFATALAPKLSDARSATKVVRCGDQFQTAILDLNSKDSHQGVITGMRFDFGIPAGNEVEVKSIELVSDPTEALPLGWERGINSSCSNPVTTLASGKMYRLSGAAAGSKLQFFNELGIRLGGETAVSGNEFEFSLPPEASIVRISSPGNVPAPALYETGRFFTPWQAKWIAHAQRMRQAGRFVFRREFEVSACRAARVQLTADDGFILKINGRIAAEKMDDWHQVSTVECTGFLQPGKNRIEVEVLNSGDWGGLLFEGYFEEQSGKVLRLVSDRSWQLFNEDGSAAAIREIGTPPVAPWGKMAYTDLSVPLKPQKKVVRGKFEPLPPVKLDIVSTPLGNRVISNGKKITLCGFKASYSAQEQWEKMTRQGVVDFQGARMSRSDRGSADFSRRKEGKLDFSGLEENIKDVLKANPSARLMISVGLDAPDWFVEKYPEEITRISSGVPCRLSTPASERLRKANEEYLYRIISHLEKSPYSGNIIAYRAVSQCDGGEYQYYCTWRRDFDGYSPAMQQRFREFLRKKYHNDPAALSAAWGRKVSFDTVIPPSPEARLRSSLGIFRDPVKERDVLDFIDCQSEVMVNWALSANRIIRKAAPDKLIASYGGYVMYYINPQLEKSGHLQFDRLLDSGLVDLYTPPQDYAMREIGSPAGSMVPHGSVRLRKQKLFSENDSRTHFGGRGGHCYAASLFEDIGLLKRDFAFNLLTDSSSYFYDMTANWFGDDRLIAEIGKFKRIGEAALDFSTEPDCPVAIFTDTESAKLLSPRGTALSAFTTREVRRELNSAGAGFADEYYLKDILRDDFPADRYKVLVFPNIYAPTPEIVKAIETKFKRPGRTLIFGYGAGIFKDGRLSAKGMAELTGMKFRIDADGSVSVPGAGKVTPAVFPAEYRCRNINGCRIICLATASAPRSFWHRILQESGVHLYTGSGDPVGGNGRFLSIHAAGTGKKVLSLPGKSNVYDIFRKHKVAENSDRFTVDMLRGETNIYFLGSEEEWQKFKGNL